MFQIPRLARRCMVPRGYKSAIFIKEIGKKYRGKNFKKIYFALIALRYVISWVELAFLHCNHVE